MKRDTRANLLFIGIFLAMVIPGAVILFKKKLNSGASSMGMAEPVRRRLPYMVPLVTPDDRVARVIPPMAGEWVSQLNREGGGGESVLMRGAAPVTSRDRVVQVTGLKERDGGATALLLAWEGDYGTELSRYRVEASSGGETLAGRVVAARKIPMPQPVKRELMSGGYIRPPAEVTWIEVAIDAPVARKEPVEIRIEYDGGGNRASAVVSVAAS